MTPQNSGTTGLVEQVRRVNQASSPEQRRSALDLLARTVRESGSTRAVFARLLSADLAAQRIAIEILLRFPLPVDDELVTLFEPLVADRDIPAALRTALAVPLLKSLPADSQRAADLVRALASGASRSKALERLRHVREKVRECPPLDAVMEHLEGRLQMRCPRCEVKLVRNEMVKHLWQQHRLMLDGQKVREPWHMVEGWVADYARTNNADLLERACELGEQLDPAGGLVRVNRLLLGAGRRDADALQTLRTEAADRHATLCPHCFAMVPMPHDVVTPPLSVSHGRLASRGYLVAVDDAGVMSHVTVSTPAGEVFSGRSGGITWRGRMVATVAPWVLLALFVAVALPRGGWVMVATLLMLLAAIGFYVVALMRQKEATSPTDRAIDAAWEHLVPALHAPTYSAADADFVRGLARASLEQGTASLRETPLAAVASLTQGAVAFGSGSPADLVELRRLEIADAAKADRDPVVVLAGQVGTCFTGDLPLDFAERLLAGWDGVSWWTRGNRVRLGVLLCAAAFEAGWEVWDLHELGEHVPLIAEAMRTEELDYLAALRRLWELKSERAWQEAGHASHVFDVARFPLLGGQYLESRPDLLLFQPMTDGDGDNASGDPILICAEGVVYRGTLIAEPTAEVIIKAKGLWAGSGFELTCGPLRLTFRHEPVFLAKRLQGWIHFLFHTFRPSVDRVLQLRSREKLNRLLRQKTLVCPECRERFSGRRGERGEPLEGA